MVKWLREKNISYPYNGIKYQIWEDVRQNLPRKESYLDRYVKEYGH